MSKEKRRKASTLQLLEKGWIRSMLIVFSVLLVMGGPTFLMYILQRFGVPPPLYSLIGLATFTIGILLFMRLSKEEKAKSS